MAKGLKVFQYIDGINDIPFPNNSNDEQIELLSYKYESQRMAPTSKITATFSYPRCLDKDWEGKEIYVTYNGENYFVRQIPSSSKNNTSTLYEHNVTFYSERFILENVYLYDVDKSDNTNVILRCNLYDFVNLINNSLKKSKLDYEVIIDSNLNKADEIKDISLENIYIAEALQQIYELWDIPYYFEGNQIIVGEYSDFIEDVILEYGYDKSLLSINKENSNFRKITRCSGYGSDRNIPEYYPNDSPKGIIDASPLSSNTILTKNMITIDSMKKFDKNIPLNGEIVYYNAIPHNPTILNVNPTFNNTLQLFNKKEDSFIRNLKLRIDPRGMYVDLDFDLSISEEFSIGMDFIGEDGSWDSSIISINSYWGFNDNDLANKISCIYNLDKSVIKSEKTNSINVCSFTINSENTTITKTGESNFGGQVTRKKFKISKNIKATLTSFVIDSKDIDDVLFWAKFIFELSLSDSVKQESILGAFHIVRYNIALGVSYTQDLDIKACINPDYKYNVTISNIKASYSTTKNKQKGWYLNNRYVELSDIGISINGTPDNSWDGEGFYQEFIDKIPISQYLMPPIYRNTWGKEKFYNALNNTHKDENGAFYTFDTLWSIVNQNEHIQPFEDLYPSIKNIKNANGEYFGTILQVAFDAHDNNDVDEEGNLLHPYFYIRIPIYNGANGFNLFDHKIFGDNMQVAITSGDCSACNFNIMVRTRTNANNDTYEDVINPIMTISENSNDLVEGDYTQKTSGDFDYYINSQQNSQTNSIWLVLQKDIDTYSETYPNVVENIIPKAGDTFVLYNIEMPKQYILSAEEELRLNILNYMKENNSDRWNFSIDFSKIYLQENQTLFNRLNENIKIKFKYDNIIYDYYVSSFSKDVKANELLPTIQLEIVKELSKGYEGIAQSITESVFDRINPYIIGWKKELQNKFLKKDEDEVMPYNIAFKKNVDIEGNTNVKELTTNQIKSKDYNTNTNGFSIHEDENGKFSLDIDNINVRESLKTKQLVIEQIKSQDGLFIQSCGAIECTNCETYTTEGYYRCYFDSTEKTISNPFEINDLAKCQRIGFSPRYYWRKVVGVGENYIDLSITDCDNNSDIPMSKDIIVQLGNTTNKDRQSAIIMSTIDNNSPSFIAYSGIDTYSLVDKDITGIIYHQETTDTEGNKIEGYPEIYSYGAMYFGNRKKDSNYIQFQKNSQGVYEMTINAKTLFKGEYVDINQLLEKLIYNNNATNNLISNGLVNDFIGAISFTSISKLESDTDYLLSIERIIPKDSIISQFEVFIEDIEGNLIASEVFNVDEDNLTPYLLSFSTNSGFDSQVDVTININSSSAILMGIKLAKGNAYVGWSATKEEQDSLILLNNAIKSYTEIIGGLVLTNVIGMKNENGNVKAGISGLSAKNNLRFWASNSWDKAEQSLFRVYDNGSIFATRAYTFMPAFEINDSNIDNYITTSSIVYLDQKTNTKQSYTYSFFNFDLTGSKILINTKNTKITRINMPVNKEYYGATIEIYNPNNSELNFSTNVPDLEYCDINNYLDKMIIQGYIGSYNSFNQDYYNFPSGLVSLNRGSMFGRVAIVKGIVNAYRFTIRRKNYKPISEYTYLRFRMVRIALNGDMRDYLGRYYSVNEDGCVYLWICEEKQKEPKFINTSSSSSSTSVPKIVGGFKK